MKTITALIVLVIAVMALPLPVFADTNDVPDFTWIIIEPGGRPGGIGKTFTGVADDTNATYYNCGGLALLEKNGVSVMHEPYAVAELKDMFQDYVAGTYRTKYGTVAGSVNYFNMGKTEWLNDAGEFLGYIHSYGIAPSVYWSYPLRTDLGLGAGFTYVYQHLSDQAGGSLGSPLVNLGVFYKTPLKGLNAGLAFNNLWTDRKEENQTFAAPRQARLGLSYKIISNDKNDLLVAGDMSKLLMNFKEFEVGDEGVVSSEETFDFTRELSQSVYAGGVEYTFAKMVSVRGGYYYDFYGVSKGMTLGVGFNYRGLGFDYSRVDQGNYGDLNRFGVSYNF
jgi:hypothetical protein